MIVNRREVLVSLAAVPGALHAAAQDANPPAESGPATNSPAAHAQNASGQTPNAGQEAIQNPILGPGDALPFRTRLASPPGDAKDVVVRFFTKRDRLAGFH